MLLEISTLLQQYGVTPRGVIHAGAHDGQEIDEYLRLGFQHGVLFEPQPQLIDRLQARLSSIPGYRVVGAALGEFDGRATLYTETANQGMSASLLKPKHHLVQYPEIQFNGSLEVPVMTLAEYFKTDALPNYNFLNMDVQGAELLVLKGGMAIISALDAIYSEVNRAELYERCARVEQIDSFLLKFGFHRTDTNWVGETWGEALYIKPS
jgi:FkbM family methyltransferase